MKKTVSCLVSFIVIIVIIIGLFWIFIIEIHPVKTEYGDFFTVRGGGLTEGYTVVDEKSDFTCEIDDYRGRKDFYNICDTANFRAYQIKNTSTDIYIIKIKAINKFMRIYNDKNSRTFMYDQFRGKFGKKIKSFFLCDEHLMEITGPFLLDSYYDEMRAVADDLNNEDYEKLMEYGLTNEMIKDTESLERKKAVMNQLIEKSSRKC